MHTHRLEDVFLEVVIQPQSAGPFNKLSSPIDIDTIFPLLARLVHQRLGNSVIIVAREFIETTRLIIVVQTGVEEGVSEASSM